MIDIMINIILIVILVYIAIRLVFYAISKSWHEAKKHVEKEDSNELQKVSEEEEGRPTKKT